MFTNSEIVFTGFDCVANSRNTVNRYVKALRKEIANYCEELSPFSGIIEVDESFFRARRIKEKRGRGSYGKTIVFGVFQRKGKVYTEIVPDCKRVTLQGIIRGQVDLESVIHSDGWRGYNGLVDLGYQKHYRVEHGKNEFASTKSLMVSRVSGRLQKHGYSNSEVLTRITFTCT